jgi:hypothetical protein
MLITAAATASPVSKPLTACTTGPRTAGAPRLVATTPAPGRAPAVGADGAECAGAVAAGAGVAAARAGVGAAGAGILTVVDAVGLGGRLIRTVSFFGCTLAASGGVGGAAPGGLGGVVSAI